jgi:hypothetical protein
VMVYATLRDSSEDKSPDLALLKTVHAEHFDRYIRHEIWLKDDGRWYDTELDDYVDDEVIAWRPRFEPYKESK